MILDVNAHLGHYPFRQLRHHTVPGLVGQMDRWNIGHALVGSVHALFYRNVHSANTELAASIRESSGRLSGYATINPAYAGWQRDLEEAVQGMKLVGARLAPSYHGYRLADAAGAAVLGKLADYDIPVVLTQRIEDRRQRHLWDAAEDLDFRDVGAAARKHANLRFVLLNWASLNPANLLNAGLRGRCLVDIARMAVVPQGTLPRLIEGFGVESVAFGTHAPFNYPTPSLIKLALLPLSEEERKQVAWRNAASFFRLTL